MEPGSILGGFGFSNRYNLVHGSDSVESVEKEIKLFFQPVETADYELTDVNRLYDGSDWL